MWNEFLSVAIDKAGEEGLREKLQSLLPLVNEIDAYEKSFIRRINESKLARGEGITQLSEEEKEEIAEYDRDAEEINHEVNDSLKQLSSATEILRILRSTLVSEIKRREVELGYYHPAERGIGEEGIALYQSLLQHLDDVLTYARDARN